MTALMPRLFASRRLIAAGMPDPIFGGRSRDELEFLPAALELIETPASPASRLTALLLTGLLASAVAWACFGKIDVVTVAPGKLVPAGGGKVIQPLESGTVVRIDAADGERVHQGQPLIELEPTETMSDRNRIQSDLAAAELQVARLSAVALGAPFRSPPGADRQAASIAQEEAAAARAEVTQRLSAFDRQIEQHRAEVAEAQAEVARFAALLPLNEQTVDVFETLAKKGYGSKLQLLDAQTKAEDTRRQLAIERAKIPELEAQIAATQRERSEAVAQAAKANLGDLSDAKIKADELTQQLMSAEQHLATRTLRAPVDGTIQELAIHTVGGVVEPGQVIMRIAPQAATVEVAAKLANKDVGFVHSGMPVAVKVETFPFTRYGVIRGMVSEVSPDAVSEKRPDGSEELTYDMKVTLLSDTLDVDGHIVRLTPGMAVTTEVKTAKRQVIQYLFSPLAKVVRESGRER